ncbi:MAG: hypothetical protein ACO1OB_22255 [Archangium sp.]
MHRLSVVVVAAMGLLGCPQKPMDSCGGETCSETQYCRESSLTCEDDLRPVVIIDGATDVVTTPTVIVTGRVVDDVQLLKTEWFAGGEPAKDLTLEEDGRFSVVVDVPARDAETMLFSVRATDKHGPTLQTIQLIVDRVGPRINVVSPSMNETLNVTTLPVRVTVTDGSNSISTLSVSGVPVPNPTVGTEFTVQLPVSGNFDNEPFEFMVSASDSRGNNTQRQASVNIDNVLPEISIVEPAAGAVVNTPTYIARAQVSDGSGLTVTFQLGNDAPVMGVSSGMVWSASLPIPAVTASLPLKVVATDALGNRASAMRDVSVDRADVVVNITAPLADSIHRSMVPVSVTTEADVTEVSASFAGGTAVMLSGSGASWSGNVPVPTGDFAARTLTVTAKDSSNNVGAAVVSVNTDTVAPVITVTSPAAAQKFKASDFASGNTVAVTWTVVDADANAATTQLDGAPFTGTSTTVTTNATDNPVSYSRTIAAADRAGNTASAMIQFSVDRVVPTVINWTPAANTRNVTGDTVITFSEAVFGAGTNDAPFSITGFPTPGGTWNSARTEFTMSLSTLLYKVLTFTTTAQLADAYGNPVASTTRRFHTATALPAGISTLFTNVIGAAFSSDSDGVLTVAVINPASCPGPCTLNGPLSVYRDSGGAMTQVAANINQTATAVWLNTWNTVDGSTLLSTPAYGVYGLTLTGNVSAWTGGSTTSAGSTGAVVSAPRLYREGGSPATYAVVSGTTYQRGTYGVTLPTMPVGLVSQSTRHISMLSAEASSLRMSRLWCGRGLISGNACGAADYTFSNSANAVGVSAVSNLSGSCEAVAWTSGGTRRYALLSKPAWEDPEAVAIAPTPQTAGGSAAPSTGRNIRFGRFTGNGEDSLIYVDYSTAFPLEQLKIRKMSSCALNSTDSEVATGPTFATVNETITPVQIGQKVGLVWQDGNTVKLWVQP